MKKLVKSISNENLFTIVLVSSLLLLFALIYVVNMYNQYEERQKRISSYESSLSNLQNYTLQFEYPDIPIKEDLLNFKLTKFSEISRSINRVTNAERDLGLLTKIYGTERAGDILNTADQIDALHVQYENSIYHSRYDNRLSRAKNVYERSKEYQTQSFFLARRINTIDGMGVYEAVKLGRGERVVLIADASNIGSSRGRTVDLAVEFLGEKPVPMTNGTLEYFATYREVSNYVSQREARAALNEIENLIQTEQNEALTQYEKFLSENKSAIVKSINNLKILINEAK